MTVPAVLLCGGEGRRMGSLTTQVPKPMLRAGGRPLVRHVMDALAGHGVAEYVLALGHLGYVIREYVLRLDADGADFTVEPGSSRPVTFLGTHPAAGWRVTCLDTGPRAGTATRLRAAAAHVSGWPVLVAYGDVLADVDVAALLRFHRGHERLATVTAVRPPARFGELTLNAADEVVTFDEKPARSAAAVSAGFFVLEREVVERYLPPDPDTMLEREPMRALAADGELMAYRHDGWWQPVDTPEDLDAVADRCSGREGR